MSTVANENNHHDGHHHEESFVSKYIFSQDHKMIGKQFLMTAVFMGVVAMMLSIFFRIQLAWPGEESTFLNVFLGDNCEREHVSRVSYYTWNDYGILPSNGWIVRDIFQSSYSIAIGCKGYGFRLLKHAFILVFLYIYLIDVFIFICI